MLSLGGKLFLLVLIGITIYAFVQRTVFLISLLRLGQGDDRYDRPGARLMYMLRQVLLQRGVLKNVTRKDRSGIGHMLIFYGFCYFTISYAFHIAEGLHSTLSPALFGSTFNNVFFLLLDMAGLVVMFSLVWAAIRRYVIRPVRLEPFHSRGALIILLTIFILMILNFSVEGFRLLYETKPFAGWAFVGEAFSRVFMAMGLKGAAHSLFYVFWYLHIALILGFGIYILYSKHLHILASHFNLYFHSTAPKGALQPILNMEEAERFGASTLTDFSWKHLLDLYACTECGQCNANCPATLSEKPLKPREVITNLKKHLLSTGNELLARKEKEGKDEENASMVKDVVTEDVLWDCTNCGACMEVCPVDIQHVDKIVDMRRYLVLTESSFAPELKNVFRGMERNSNPWGIGMSTRADWAKDQGVKILSEDGGDVDFLYYVGCVSAFDTRSQKIAMALVKILQAAGINFGILGTEEKCCGDSARRIGNEYLYQMMAQENIEILKQYNFKKILVACPHGYNTLKNEYPKLGGHFEVIHHSELILQLIREGRLPLQRNLEKSILYHDSCFLGRYNTMYDPPRQILTSIAGKEPVEMDRNRRYAFCCGAGGGRMWMEETRGKRILAMRTEQALSKTPDIIATACPFCMIHFNDGLKFLNAEEKAQVSDIAELVANQLKTK